MNNFRFYNRKNGFCFEDISEEIYTLELPQVPNHDDGMGVWEWMRFLCVKRKEEFKMVAAQNPEIRKAVNTLYELSVDEKVRAEYEIRLKAIRDTQWRIDSARDEGWNEGVTEVFDL